MKEQITVDKEQYMELLEIKEDYIGIINCLGAYRAAVAKAILDVRREPASINQFLNALESITK